MKNEQLNFTKNLQGAWPLFMAHGYLHVAVRFFHERDVLRWRDEFIPYGHVKR